MNEAIQTKIENLHGYVIPDEVIDEDNHHPTTCPMAKVFQERTGFFPFVLPARTFVFATAQDRKVYLDLVESKESEPLSDPYKHPELHYGLTTMIDEVSHGDYLEAWICAHDDGLGFQIRLETNEKGDIELDPAYGEEQAIWDLWEAYGLDPTFKEDE